MKKAGLFSPHMVAKALVLSTSLVALSACAESKDPPVQKGGILEEQVRSGKILPYYIVFNNDGSTEVRGINIDGGGARVVDVKRDEFPIKAKIKKIETITLVTYEGSCEVLYPAPPSGYKKIIIQNDALCAKILP